MDKIKGRAIITYGRSLMAVVIAHSLSKRGIEVISCDSIGMTAASFSKHTIDNFIHADPEEDLEQYLHDLETQITAHKPKDDCPYLLIPTFRDAKLLSKYHTRLDNLITLAVTDFDIIDRIDPKHHLFKTVEHLNLPAPKGWHPSSQKEVIEAMREIQLPALIKAVDEVGGRGIEFFDNEIDMTARAVERMQTENPPPLLQEQTPGEDYCLTVLYKEGELLAHMAYHNIQTMPSDGAAGAMRETIDDTPFLEIANKLMAEINWTGVAEIDFMWTGDPKDTPHLIEVNPRFWAGLFQSVESGIDFPWLVYHLYAYGFVPDVNEAVVGTKTRIPVAWAAGALSEAFSEDIDMEGAQKAWREMLSDVKDGELNNAAHSLKTAFAKITNFEGAIDLLRSQSRHAQEAKSELMIKDDPLSSLGVFFVLSSLIRHGKLPPEIKS